MTMPSDKVAGTKFGLDRVSTRMPFLGVNPRIASEDSAEQHSKVSPSARRVDAAAIGGRTLEIFANTPQVNGWIYSKLASHIRGDVLEVGSGIGNLSRLIVKDAASTVLSDVEAP